MSSSTLSCPPLAAHDKGARPLLSFESECEVTKSIYVDEAVVDRAKCDVCISIRDDVLQSPLPGHCHMLVMC